MHGEGAPVDEYVKSKEEGLPILDNGEFIIEDAAPRKSAVSNCATWQMLPQVALLVWLVVMPSLVVLDVILIGMKNPSLFMCASLAAKFALLVYLAVLARRCRGRQTGAQPSVGKAQHVPALVCTGCLVVGIFIAYSAVMNYLVADYPELSGPYPIVESNSTASPKVAIIGAGPSGMGALWALRLHAPKRDVTVFEMTDSVGGHATTVHDRGNPIDIGFIFSIPGYSLYQALRSRFGFKVAISNISVAYHGDQAEGYDTWDNVGRIKADPALVAEIERFYKDVYGHVDMLTLIQPLGFWLWRKGYSAKFVEGVLRPMLTPLFVTAKGCMMQSAGATLKYFQSNSGMHFLSMNLPKDGSPQVYHTFGGVNELHRAIVDEAKPKEKLKLNTAVESVRKMPNGRWRVTYRKTHGMKGGRCDTAHKDGCMQTHLASDWNATGAPSHEDFDHVVMATSAKIAARILDPTTTIAMLLKTIDYDDFRVTLSEPVPDDDVRTNSALYHIYPQGLMSGAIDRILELGPKCPTSFCPGNYKLEVEPDSNPWRPPSHFGPRIIATRKWHHHRFTLWELMLMRRVLPRLNHIGGLHIAGDYTKGYGHNDALVSGLESACKIGIAKAAKATIHSASFGLGSHLDIGKHCPL
mmetsp:Transcript_68120/g.135023  ORF Transcript_68120/g.135023 Transcript_68120/m.135023 type:complete len:638 (-) Transcript_68120:541-2454(-)|eukprot:CAMPEP_0174729686 /NCGR_PEP_ID=MMETSP1094-20130205/54158_1 /TAXON_ID=156173 /ORGANISM="Chrysochromulina brevifilum, Strain UTEX LB 985" /LENGTH=637 /DNA_ID=CAMNT_0015931831 /DNA_START=51 /DNA_END=1964 /DNA_ORIENTATION=+